MTDLVNMSGFPSGGLHMLNVAAVDLLDYVLTRFHSSTSIYLRLCIDGKQRKDVPRDLKAELFIGETEGPGYNMDGSWDFLKSILLTST